MSSKYSKLGIPEEEAIFLRVLEEDLKETLPQIDLKDHNAKKHNLFGFTLVNNHVNSLFLSTKNLRHIPETIRNLKHLKSLYLSCNQLKNLPSSFNELKELEVLDLSYNNGLNLPNHLFVLDKLTHLDISYCDFENSPVPNKKVDSLIYLNLSCNNLTNLPEEYSYFSNLEILDLSFNPKLEIPNFIFKYKKLTILNLSICSILEVPNNFDNLINLVKLDISSNQLNKLPSSIISLKKLKSIDLSYNEFNKFPDLIFDLTTLEEINLSNNKIENISENISNLKSLKKLNLNFNIIKKLPENITKLENLENLYLIENQLEKLPDSLAQLKNLKELYLTNNNLTKFPKSLKQLENLEWIFISDNKIEDFSQSTFLNQQIEKLMTLHEIRLKNIFSFKDSLFTNIDQLAILTGANNSGKSNFFKTLLSIKPNSFVPVDFFYSGSNYENAEITLTFKLSEEFLYYYKEYIKKFYWKIRVVEFNDLIINIDENFFNVINFLGKIKAIIRFYLDGNDYKAIIDQFGFIINDKILNLVDYKNRITYDGWVKINDINWNEIIHETKKPIIHLDNSSLLKREISDVGQIQSTEKIITEFKDKNIINLIFFYKEILKFFENLVFIEEIRSFRKNLKINFKNQLISKNGGNFPQILANFFINQPKNHQLLEDLIKEFYSNIDILKFEGKDESTSLPYIIETYNKKRYFDNIGKGMHQLLIILTHLIQLENNYTLLIEEPELFIHPKLQKILLSIIRKFLKGHQILITTHSPFLINTFEKNQSVHDIQKRYGNSVVKNVDNTNVINVFRRLGVNPSDLLLYNGLILVEGKTDYRLIEFLLKEFLIENHIEILPFEGKHSLHFITDHKLLSNLISKGFQFLILLDKDEGNKKIIETVKDRAVKDYIMLLPVREIENLYLNPKIIGKYLSENYSESFKEDDIENYLVNLIDNLIDDNLIWEFIVKTFFERIPLQLTAREIKKFLVQKDKSEWFNDYFNYIKKRYWLSELDKNKFFSIFDEIKDEYDKIKIQDKWKVFPGKKLRKQIFQRIKKEKGINIALEKLEIIMKEDQFINDEIIDKIKNYFDFSEK